LGGVDSVKVWAKNREAAIRGVKDEFLERLLIHPEFVDWHKETKIEPIEVEEVRD
jgi:hypothetical protein